jgi:2,5-diketo-D-gluconate reductase A
LEERGAAYPAAVAARRCWLVLPKTRGGEDVVASAPILVMNDGRQIPQVGLGLRLIPAGELGQVLSAAVGLGYRLVDTAQTYGNEAGVGQALAAGAVTRDQLFITTKIANRNQGRARAMASFEESRSVLGAGVVDLLLIHWPMPMLDEYIATWHVLEELQSSGLVRSIGVSNFTAPHLRRLLGETGVPPAVNQVELHPSYHQESLREFHAEHGILTQAWAPLGQGGSLLGNPLICRIAADKGRSPAQIVLRWHVQLGNIVIPKSSSPQRMAENLAVFDFALDESEMKQVSGLPEQRMGPDPETHSAR